MATVSSNEIAAVAALLMERKVSPHPPCTPFTLTPVAVARRAQLTPLQTASRRSAIQKALSELVYLSVGSDQHFYPIIQKRIVRLLLSGVSGTSAPWPLYLSRHEALRLTPFTTYLCIALYNAICLVHALREGQPATRTDSIVEFLDQADARMKSATPGDLFTAHFVSHAVADLSANVDAEIRLIHERRRWWERFFGMSIETQKRLAAAHTLKKWLNGPLKQKLRSLSRLEELLVESEPWQFVPPLKQWHVFIGQPNAEDDPVPTVEYGLLALGALPRNAPLRRYLAWRVALRIRNENVIDLVPLTTLRKLLNGKQFAPAARIASHIVTEVLAGLTPHDAEETFERFSPNWTENPLAALCANILDEAAQAAFRTGARDAGEGGHWERTLAQTLALAMKSGPRGHAFVGIFLIELVRDSDDESLGRISAAFPSIDVLKLCREWFWCTLLYINPNLKLQTTPEIAAAFAALQDGLKSAHGNMRFILAGQKAVWKFEMSDYSIASTTDATLSSGNSKKASDDDEKVKDKGEHKIKDEVKVEHKTNDVVKVNDDVKVKAADNDMDDKIIRKAV